MSKRLKLNIVAVVGILVLGGGVVWYVAHLPPRSSSSIGAVVPGFSTSTTDTSLHNPLITLGTPETVFGSTQTTVCDKQRTDTRVSAFRRDDGQIDFFSSNSQNYAFVGSTMSDIKIDPSCRRIFVPPPQSENPGDYHGKMWLKNAIETPQGDIIGFIHNEYHGELYDPVCKAAHVGSAEPCWYASSLIAVSHDGGVTFDTNSTKPLAVVPFKYEKMQGRVAYSSPYPLSHREGDTTPYMYAFVSASDQRVTTDKENGGTCIMRGTSADPATWRMWGGKDFDVTVANPYATNVTDPGAHTCKPVLDINLGSVKYLPLQKEYLALGTRGLTVVYAVSKNLIDWTDPKILMSYSKGDNGKEGGPLSSLYYSLLDLTSPSRSFETLEDHPYMYYITYQGTAINNAILVRVPIKVTF